MKLLVATFILAVPGIFVSAQQDQKPPTAAQQTEKAAKVIAELAAARTPSGGVKNAPFSADEINESVQTLADGNRITRSTTGKIYRNSAGRFRRDMPGGKSGMLGSTYTVQPGVTILDSAGGFKYQLNTELKTAQQTLLTVAPEVRVRTELLEVERAKAAAERAAASVDRATAATERAKMQVELEKLAATPMPAPVVQAMPMPMPGVPPMPPVAVIAGDAGQLVPGAMGSTAIHPGQHSKYETRTEDLGTQNIEGIDAVGTRTTTIIPAGAIGNERAIEVVYERWYSNELRMIIYSKRSDPRVGEQTYRLTNINRSEPDPALFSVSGYRLVGPARKTSPVATTAGEKGKPVKSPYIKNFN